MNEAIRRALEDAKVVTVYMQSPTSQNAGNLMEAGRNTLPNAKAMARELARLHRDVWWEITRSDNQYRAVMKLGETMPRDTTMDACIAASPEWRAAWLADYGIDYKEIEHD